MFGKDDGDTARSAHAWLSFVKIIGTK